MKEATQEKTHCGRCQRKLRTPKSRRKGFGPVCERKVLEDAVELVAKMEKRSEVAERF